MQSIEWYFNRVRRMSMGEVLWRAGKAARGAMKMARPERAAAPEVDVEQAEGVRFVCVPQGIDHAPYREAAQQIIDGRYPIFELEECRLGDPPQWNRDPRSGWVAPLVPAAALDYRDQRRVGDIKYLWEPNRHLHLVKLAQAYALTGEEIYARQIVRQVDSWIEQCPPGMGPNWVSALEQAIRLINWSVVWQLLGGARSPVFNGKEGKAFRDRWLAAIYLQTRAIARNLSRYSSANNHLIGEVAGVWIASLTWPYWKWLRACGQRCRSVLEREALRQNAPDGGNREQALSYQQFVLDFLLLSGLAARAAGRDFTPEYWERLECMIGFLAALMDVGGNVPMIGDADDGYVLSLAPQSDVCPYRSLLATGAVLFDREDWAVKAIPEDAKTAWLLGDKAKRGINGTQQPSRTFDNRREFPDAGYYLLGDGFGTEDEVRMLVDAGPLGYLSLAAHGHADALSMLLNVGGQEVLIDPGTFAYHTQPEWRRYFRGTQAHNTMMVDGRDQSEQGGNFMWSHHAKARCVEFADQPGSQRFVGEHDGYSRLADPVIHRREIDYDERERSCTVADTLVCSGVHRAHRCWHFSDRLEPKVAGDGSVRVQAGRFTVELVPCEPLQALQVHWGAGPEQGGWVSRRFGRKTPCTTVIWESPVRAQTTLRSFIRITKAVPEAAAVS